MNNKLVKDIFTVANIITLLRIVSIPFFVYFTVTGKEMIGLIILTVAAASDLFDGMLARKLNQVTNIGKALDPVADKLMHVAALIALAVIGYISWVFVILLFLKESAMVIGSIVLIKNKKIIQANDMGKFASLAVSIGVILSFFHPFMAENLYYLDWIALSIGMVLTYVAMFIYLDMTKKALKGEKVEGSADIDY